MDRFTHHVRRGRNWAHVWLRVGPVGRRRLRGAVSIRRHDCPSRGQRHRPGGARPSGGGGSHLGLAIELRRSPRPARLPRRAVFRARPLMVASVCIIGPAGAARLATELLLICLDPRARERARWTRHPTRTGPMEATEPLDERGPPFNPKVPGSRPGRPTESEVTGLVGDSASPSTAKPAAKGSKFGRSWSHRALLNIAIRDVC